MTQINGPVRIGIGGPVGAGKTTLTARLSEALKHQISIGVITNDIYTQEDAEALTRMQILPSDRIIGVETIWLRLLRCNSATPIWTSY